MSVAASLYQSANQLHTGFDKLLWVRGFYAMVPYRLNQLPNKEYTFQVIAKKFGVVVTLGILLAGCGGSSGQSAQLTQSVGATSNTDSSNTTSDSTTTSNTDSSNNNL